MNTLQIGDVSLQEKEGGLGRYFSELLRHLPLSGTGCHGLVVGQTLQDEAKCVTSFASMSDSLATRMIKVRKVARARLHAEHVDVVAAHFAPYGLPLLDRTSGSRLVVHFHGPWAAESATETGGTLAARAKAAIEKLVYIRAERLIVLSDFFKQELVRRYRVKEELIRVIPGGIDTVRFHTALSRAEARAILGWPADRTILLSVRRQVRRMGLEELIDAMKVIVSRHPEALLLLGGSGPIASELKARIQEHGLHEHVKLLGRVDDVLLPLAYRAADLSVVPSRALEGFGLVTLESLASGTPVFVTAVGGLPEVIGPFAPECIFDDASSRGMAARLEAVLSGAIDLPSDQACRSYVEEHFSWPAIASRVRAVYDEAVA